MRHPRPAPRRALSFMVIAPLPQINHLHPPPTPIAVSQIHAGTRQRLGHRDAVLQVRLHPFPCKGLAQTVALHPEPMHRIAIPRLGLLEVPALRQPPLVLEYGQRLAHHRQRLFRVRQMRGPHLATLGAEHHLDAAMPISQSPLPLY